MLTALEFNYESKQDNMCLVEKGSELHALTYLFDETIFSLS